MSMIAAAAIAATGAVAGAGISAAGASSAANQSRKSLNQGYGLASKTLGANDKFLAQLYTPYITQANTYGQRLNDELIGGSLSVPYDWNRYRGEAGLSPTTTQANFLTQYGLDDFKKQYGVDPSTALKQYGTGDFQNEFGVDLKSVMRPTAAFDPSNIQMDPGFAFRLNQGAQTLDRSAAARGGVLSGGQAKAMQRYAQDYSSGEYQNAYDRAANTYGINQANEQDYRNTALGQYNASASQRAINNAAILGQYNTAAEQKAQNNQLNLANYYDAAKLAQIQNAQKYDQLAGMYNTALGMVNNYAAGRSSNAAQMANYGTGAATAQGQNAWNKAGAQSSAWGGAMGNISNLAGMYMMMNGMNFGGSGGPLSTSDANSVAAMGTPGALYPGASLF